MDDQKALSIVSALANGVNPLTGEVFPADSAYQSPDVVRALFVAVRALQGGGAAAPSTAPPEALRSRTQTRNNVGKPWTEDEDRRLLTEFERGCSPRELAAVLGRSLAGIEARLERHGRIQPQQRETSNRFGQSRPDQNGDSRGAQGSRSA
jgi:hypothetical protein